jgi:hypothetical protein
MAALLKTTQIQEPSSATVNIALDSSGNVGIGTTSPSYPLDVAGTGVVRISPTTGTNQATLLASNTGGNFYFGKNDSAGSQFATDAYASVVWSSGNRPIAFATNGTEYMRLNSSGNLLVAKTSVGATAIGVELRAAGDVHSTLAASTGASTTYEVYSTGASAFRFYVDLGGTIHATSTSITAISDQSLKTNVKPLETGLAEVMRLQPRRFDWVDQTKTEGTNIAGFIAQEVEQILPDLVGSFKYNDNETKLGLKMGDMIPTLVKAIQEQQATIASLTTRIATLEAK